MLDTKLDLSLLQPSLCLRFLNLPLALLILHAQIRQKAEQNVNRLFLLNVKYINKVYYVDYTKPNRQKVFKKFETEEKAMAVMETFDSITEPLFSVVNA